MTKKILFLFSVAILLVSCAGNNSGEQDTADSLATDSLKTEAEKTEITTIQLSDFDQQAKDFVDKEIIVEGIVDHVCEHGGKRILIVNEDGTGKLRITSETQFEDTLIGSQVKVKGTVSKFTVDEAYCAKLEEEAKNTEEEKDTEDHHNHKLEQAKHFRDSMKAAGVDALEFYSLEFVSFE